VEMASTRTAIHRPRESSECVSREQAGAPARGSVGGLGSSHSPSTSQGHHIHIFGMRGLPACAAGTPAALFGFFPCPCLLWATGLAGSGPASLAGDRNDRATGSHSSILTQAPKVVGG